LETVGLTIGGAGIASGRESIAAGATAAGASCSATFVLAALMECTGDEANSASLSEAVPVLFASAFVLTGSRTSAIREAIDLCASAPAGIESTSKLFDENPCKLSGTVRKPKPAIEVEAVREESRPCFTATGVASESSCVFPVAVSPGLFAPGSKVARSDCQPVRKLSAPPTVPFDDAGTIDGERP
jgi:hypothetical protein